jgi:hypothetical protein
MNAYWPAEATTPSLVLALLGSTLAAGLALTRPPPTGWTRAAAWALVVGATAGSERLCAAAPDGFRMLAICAALLFGMKAVVAVESRARLTPLQWFAFAALWPGMRAGPFASLPGPGLAGAARLVRHGFQSLALGLALIFLAATVGEPGASATGVERYGEPGASATGVERYGEPGASATGVERYGEPGASATGAERPGSEEALLAATGLLLVGLSLAFHFGIFNVAAGAWRALGVGCRPLFRAPLRSQSLTEFWSRRWNLAFSEMLALTVYRPLAGAVGRRTAVFLSFLGSGILHELAISVPVRAGYGLPTLYFSLHGLLTLLEQEMARRGWPIERLGWLARLWTLGWLVAPLPLLFHPWFICGVIWPIAGMS